MSEQLKPCPCGEVPTKLFAQELLEGDATVCGFCCRAWQVTFQLAHRDDLYSQAASAWNSAPRSKE